MGIKFNDKKLSAQLRGIIRRSQDLSKPMKIIAMDMKKSVQNNFDKEQSFNGKKWKKSKRAIEQGGQTLKNTGRLYNSFSTSSGRNFAQTGTNVKYARMLNQGAKKGEFGTTTYTVKAHQRKTKIGTVNVRSHSRTGQAPFGNIQAFQYIGFNKRMKQRYIRIIKTYILDNKIK